ncbi:MAG: hypothetical protein IKE43_10220 [Coriobacteriales bacterium]|nr:hypothetical protein [Coriobacteriales bacterium]
MNEQLARLLSDEEAQRLESCATNIIHGELGNIYISSAYVRDWTEAGIWPHGKLLLDMKAFLGIKDIVFGVAP